MHAIERELIKVTGYKPKRKFSDREDYLKSLLNDVMKLTDADFDDLTDEAAAWTNAAVDAHNSKNIPIPDFDEVPASDDEAEDEPEADETEETAEEADEPVSDADEDELAGDEDDSDIEDESSEDESEAVVEDEPEDEDEPAPKPAKKKVVAKEKTKFKIPPKPKVAAAPSKPQKAKSTDDEEDVVVDKWGCMEGSKNAQALAMFERGATSKEVKDEIGGTYYNILKKAEQNGHKLEKDGAIIKLTHRDANKPPVKKKK